ncbi:C-type lectin domain family 4 member A-like isoform X2 [Pangasianodon hypophthalmus]|uniref:C-type lectin domain family 4 member A-like isoform X2 n=1 Tax=Pangasianodon hypophthalmus TaxID=310915 RepID=UPI0023081C94|nr:C-type lectin domain family 4 member A-like isoform X2 [Pangasianodon hypophthalmus]
MDAEKLTEVEMKELTSAEVQDDKDAEKDKMGGTKAEKGAEEEEKKEKEIKEAANVYHELKKPTEDVYNPSMPTSSSKHDEETEKKAEEKEKKEKESKEEGNVYCKLKNPTEDTYNTGMPTPNPKRNEAEKVKEIEKEEEDEEDEETNLYCKLKNPSENVYMSTMTSSTPKHNKDIYKRISAVFIILSVLLLAVVLALAMKLNEGQSIQKCPERPEAEEPEVKQQNCTRELCEDLYPSTNPGYQCSECGKGWVRFDNSCFFISKERLSWQESRKTCQKQGGDLVVIRNEYVQKTLTKYWGMLYWIGLRYSEKQRWMWVNNTALTKSYWAQGQPESDSQGSCALLRGRGSPTNNWHSNPCVVSSNYICQRG